MSYCYKTSDNKHFGCPPRMADGRHFTDYRPNCYVNNLIKADNGTQNSFQYRQFLTHNAAQLMDINRHHACQKNCCTQCEDPFHQGTMLPEMNKFVCDKSTCKLIGNDPNGLGTGRVYQPVQECANLPSAWPVDGKNNVCITPKDAANYYPLDESVYKTSQRVAVPGGGVQVQGGDHRMIH